MKVFKQLLFLVLALSITTSASAAMVANADNNNTIVFDNQTFTQEEFLALTPKAIKKQTGKKLKLKEKLALKMAQKQIKKAEKRPNDRTDKILIFILCFIIPPLAVYLIFDEINNVFWINVILTLLGGLPGVIHALIVAVNNL